MSEDRASVLARLRQPEHTGDDRCVPCTVLNGAIALGLGGALALVSIPLAGVVFLISVLAIYLRGYLIPGTPTLTERYLPDSVLRRLGTHRGSTTDPESLEVFERIERERQHAVDPSEFLLDVGVFELCADGEEFCLTDAFAGTVTRHANALQSGAIDEGLVADVFGVDPGEVEPVDREYPAFKTDIRIRKWPSEAALISDLATHRALADHTDRWADVPVDQRVEMLESLRGFQDACLLCGGQLVFDDVVVDSCCGRHEVTTITCSDCGRRLREFDQARAGGQQELKGLTP